MHEPVAPPKEQVPYAWLMGGVAILSVCAMVMSVTHVATDNKKLDALITAQAAAESRERLLVAKIDSLSFVLKKLDAARIPQLLAEASKAHDEGKLKLAKARYNEIYEIDPNYPRIRELSDWVSADEYEAAKVKGNDAKWKIKNLKFLADIDSDKTVTRTATGLRYRIIRPGGSVRPDLNSSVKCRYDAKLVDGQMLENTSLFQYGMPRESHLSKLKSAWAEGLQLIGVGGRLILYIPPSLAYGDESIGDIPGYSVLVYEIELVEITK